MKDLPKKFTASLNINEPTYTALKVVDQTEYIVEGNNQTLDGNDIACHLLHIHNSDVTIRELTFKNGSTEMVRHLKRKDLVFPKPKGSVFEIIDGGAVLITGKSNVTFENCTFLNNTALMCGGAISNQSTGKVIFRNCLFKDNTSGHTGSAIDNLTRGSDLAVEDCTFINNISNLWNRWDSPHGQVTIFPGTVAEIINSKFKAGSTPFDFKDRDDLISRNNIYEEFTNWSEAIVSPRIRPVTHFFTMVKKLYWLPLKTRWNVYYRVNR